MKRRIMQVSVLLASAFLIVGCATQIDTSRVYVPEEGGINFIKVTDESAEQLIRPNIQYTGNRLTWWANPYFAINNDGTDLAYICSRNEKSNIFVKSLASRSGSQQRTFTGDIQDVTFSPDGNTICFSKLNGQSSNNMYGYANYSSYNTIYTTNAKQGSVVQQISAPNVKDYGPRYSPDGSLIFFARNDGNEYAIWSQNISTGTLSYYCYGTSPFPINNEEFLCVRRNSANNYEIWRINYVKGSESIILSQENRSFTTPSLSPDGKWIVCTSNSNDKGNENLDIYVVRTDGSRLTQLTYHPGHDLSPVWSPDGKSIYFLSQRGSEKGTYNVWKMNFNL